MISVKLFPVVSLLFVLTISTGLFADEAADHQALRDLKTLYESAIADDKIDLLAPHLHEQFSGVMVTGDIVNSFDDLKSYWARMKELMGDGAEYTFSLEPDDSTIFGDLALSKGTTTDTLTTGGGKTYKFTSAWTALSQRVDGAWKLRRIQGSMNPVENDFVAAGIKWASIVAGGIAGLVGLVLGFLLRVLTSRKS